MLSLLVCADGLVNVVILYFIMVIEKLIPRLF